MPAHKPRKMYIDVDGVLVVWDAAHNCVELARGLGRLMRFCRIHEIQPCWLSLWSRNPATLEGVNSLLWPKTCPTMATPRIIPLGPEGKIAAIDFDSDFVWIEDGISPDDMAVLERRGMADRFFCADGLDPDCLLNFMEFTRRRLNLPEIADWGPPWDSVWTRPRGSTKDPSAF